MDLEEIKLDVLECLSPILKDAAGILVYGSWARNEASERSDIDICVVAPGADGIGLARKALSLARDDRFDIRVFELMPLYLKMAVINEGMVIYAKDILELYEYFYFFRKLWEDQKHRQSLSKEEAIKLLAAQE